MKSKSRANKGLIKTCYLNNYIMAFLCIFILFAVLPTWALGEKPYPQTADFNEMQSLRNNQVKAEAGGKEKYFDRSDFYFLDTGKKASFLRKEKTYLIIHDRKRVTSSMLSETIKGMFGDRLDVVKDHPLHKFVKVKIKNGEDPADIISTLRQAYAEISFISPVLKSSSGGTDIAITPEIIVSINDAFDPDVVIAELQNYNLSLVSKLAFTDTEYVLKIEEPVSDIGRIFELTRIVADLPFVNWAEPNFLVSAKKQFTSNDTLFNDQWHLNNTGQNGGTVDADVDAPEGWDYTQGSGTIIGIYDDSVDISHEDLNIWSNPGETGGGKETNGIDDDGNGYVDDFQGWDFSDNDNDPSPVLSTDNHGTAVAGVAGAVGNNSLGVSGSAPGAVILPVRMGSGLCTTFADAMRYAGKYSDVVSNSWTIGGCSSNLNAAISDAVNGNIAGARRGTKGTPVLFAAGNSASGWRKYTLTDFSAGSYSFRWRFSKDGSVSDGYDTVWLDNITWPGGSVTDFESDTVGNIPTGFTSSGSAAWTVVNDGVHARGASGNSVKAGTITHNQETNFETTRAVGSGALTFWVWVSSEQGWDFWEFYVDGTRYFQYAPGQNGHVNDVGYPASNPYTIAVGASNDGGLSGLEERTYYSQFGPEVDVVAPSSGGLQGITTTDRMGGLGYSISNYTSTFGGTSSATPLVAGIAADIIADDPSLAADEVRTILRSGADKIGPYAYTSSRNNYYGYGRVNLLNSLFVCLNPLVRIIGDPTVYSTLQSAYDAAGDGNTIQSQAVVFTEDLDIDLNKSVTLEGGYDCDYTANNGETTLNGMLTVTNGTLTIENFVLE